VVALVAAIGYGSWTVYHDRQTATATADLNVAMKAYSGRIAGSTPEPQDASEVSYKDEAARSNDALNKFNAVANKYPGTLPGKQARYYAALCLEDLDRQNQALEDLKKLASGGDKELASMAQYQVGVIYSRTGKPDEAGEDSPRVGGQAFRIRSTAGGSVGTRQCPSAKQSEGSRERISAVKKEFPDTAISEQADRGLDLLAPKS